MVNPQDIEIGLDFGHGEDTYTVHGSKGITVNGVAYEEHHFNAEVGLIVDKRLREHGFKTILGQPAYKNDVALATRSTLYNKEQVDFVVSIHGNAGVPTAKGMGIFYWGGSKEGLNFSQKFVANWKAMITGVGIWGKSGIFVSERGSWTNFHIVRETNMPAVLIEAGFFTNLENDFKYMFGEHKTTFRPQVAEAIVKTVCDYYGVAYKAPSAPVTAQPAPNGHKVQVGETMYSIARKYGIDVAELQRANPNVNPRAMQVGSVLAIPKAVSGVVVVPVPPAPKYPLPTGTLRRGSKGEAVKQLQNALNALYFKVGTVDGDFGFKTEDALRRFQKVHDAYNVDGVYGSRTRDKLNQLLNK